MLKVPQGHHDGGLGLVVEQQVASFEISGVGLPTDLRGGRRSGAALAQPDVDTARDRLGHIRLQLDHIFEAAVEALRPDVHLVAHADKLRGNAHMRTGLAHATFQHIVDTHLVPNLVDALAAVLVFHCRRARDNSKPVRIHRAEL